ncbi:hypothetical protein BT96DRAFT_459890 [Gymnopus androsaceus JB14]|uniref:Uncharacterized protein n=1 Tax=Gymnopus androsaceus JB14 TaxID=1447944 RepID=A0A6A4IGY2_9AGAR|nr:hypothetical protein BT96DRAFT_459890 [Gymnopus androsaceus JB14]
MNSSTTKSHTLSFLQRRNMCSYTSHLITKSSMLVQSTPSIILPLRGGIWLNLFCFIHMHCLTCVSPINLFTPFQHILSLSPPFQGYLRPGKVFFARVIWHTEESSLFHQGYQRESPGHYQ